MSNLPKPAGDEPDFEEEPEDMEQEEEDLFSDMMDLDPESSRNENAQVPGQAVSEHVSKVTNNFASRSTDVALADGPGNR